MRTPLGGSSAATSMVTPADWATFRPRTTPVSNPADSTAISAARPAAVTW